MCVCALILFLFASSYRRRDNEAPFKLCKCVSVLYSTVFALVPTIFVYRPIRVLRDALPTHTSPENYRIGFFLICVRFSFVCDFEWTVNTHFAHTAAHIYIYKYRYVFSGIFFHNNIKVIGSVISVAWIIFWFLKRAFCAANYF